MAIERERKFLVHADKLSALLPMSVMYGGYIVLSGYFTKDGIAIRVTRRIGGKCKVCFKSGTGEERQEFEYIIPENDAIELMKLSPTFLKKVRYEFKGWEIDRIELPSGDGHITHLWVAEWEEHEGKDPFPETLPAWIDREVTGDPRFSMQGLAWVHGKREPE